MKNLETIMNEYLEHQLAINSSPHTLKNAKSILKKFIKFLANLNVNTADRITAKHLYSWQTHLIHLRTDKGLLLKPRTINTKIGKVTVFLRFMAKRGYINFNLTEIIEYIKEPSRLPHGIVEHSDMKNLLKKIDISNSIGYRDRTILELMYSSGVRAGEITNLNIRDIDLKTGTAKVLGKGNKERIVPIGETSLRFIESYMKAIRPFFITGDEKDALFLNNFGRRLQYGTLFRIVHKYCDDNADLNITAHTFRRSCTTEMIKGGANIYHVKEMLGHENLDTLKHYVKLSITDLKKTHSRTHPRERESK